MQVAPLPLDEQARLESLRRFGILDTAADSFLDRLTRFATRYHQVSMAAISLVDADRQWFKSKCGLDVVQTDRDLAFCAHAILEESVFVVLDTHADERFADNPLVTGAPYLRFYAGVALCDEQGHKLGTFCILDDKPRKNFSDDDAQSLEELAATAMEYIKTCHLANGGAA